MLEKVITEFQLIMYTYDTTSFKGHKSCTFISLFIYICVQSL
jgi:hypothetical protein